MSPFWEGTRPFNVFQHLGRGTCINYFVFPSGLRLPGTTGSAGLDVDRFGTLVSLVAPGRSARHIHIHVGRGWRLNPFGPVRSRVRRGTRPVAGRFRRWRRVAVQRLDQVLRRYAPAMLARWRQILIERRLLAVQRGLLAVRRRGRQRREVRRRHGRRRWRRDGGGGGVLRCGCLRSLT